MAKMKARVSELLKQLSAGLYEREGVLRLALLSSLSGESLFMLGAPGVAKSLVARRLKYAFSDASTFEYLMNRFSTPEEIFGPISISKLKDEGKYERMVDGYLPSADIVFLDEIWKAGPSIQNTLLTVLNEKIYRNGTDTIHVPLKALIAASNELPAKGEGLEALWDRFLLRVSVSGIAERSNFEKMLTDTTNPNVNMVGDVLKISVEDYKQMAREIDNISVPKEVLSIINTIRHKIQEHNDKHAEEPEQQIYVSDRRWRKIVRILRSSAYLNDRKEVDAMDCFLMTHCLWDKADQIDLVEDFVRDAIAKFSSSTQSGGDTSFDKQLKAIEADVKQECLIVRKSVEKVVKTIDRRKYYKLNGEDLYVEKDEYDANPLSMEVYAYTKGGQRRYYGDRTKSSLKLEKVEKTSEERKTPHPAAVREWDDKLTKIEQDIEEQLLRIDIQVEEQAKTIRTNLFVDEKYAEVIERGYQDSKKKLNKQALEVERIRKIYKNPTTKK